MVRPDVPVFPLVAEVRPVLRLPFLGVADSHRGAACWLDAGHGVALPVCLGRAGAIPEVLLQGRMAVDAERLAGRAQLPADAVPDRLAWAWSRERLASAGDSEERWAQRRVAVALYIRAADQFAA